MTENGFYIEIEFMKLDTKSSGGRDLDCPNYLGSYLHNRYLFRDLYRMMFI